MRFCYKYGLLKKVKAHLKRGGVIAYATESCFGLGCDPYNYKAINKILRLKVRSKTKGLIVVASKDRQIEKLVKPVDSLTRTQISQYWPGPYSLILDAKTNINRNLIGSHNGIAIRVSKSRSVVQLCNFIDKPVVSTSANRAKHLSIKTTRLCKKKFASAGVLVLPGLVDGAKSPSTIINLKTNKILR
jgi:L-threonylcarbamoyladenylate synthase